MGIQAEFNPDLALRAFGTPGREKEECLPEKLEAGEVYSFLKRGMRLFWLTNSEDWSGGQLPLVKTEGDEKLSRPIASIKMLEVTHFLINEEVWTKGKYKLIEVFDLNDGKIQFESYKRIKQK